MTRSPDADKMHKALKQIVVPYLRQQGCKGTFPHFRRLTETKIDLLSFQFRIQGGGFFIDLASSTLDGFVDGSGNLVPPNKLTAYYEGWRSQDSLRLWGSDPNRRLVTRRRIFGVGVARSAS